jgi:hypothetical protein
MHKFQEAATAAAAVVEPVEDNLNTIVDLDGRIAARDLWPDDPPNVENIQGLVANPGGILTNLGLQWKLVSLPSIASSSGVEG